MSSELKVLSVLPSFQHFFQLFDCAPTSEAGFIPLLPVLGALIVSTVFTMLVQSSAAALGIVLALSGGGLIIFDKDELTKIYETGRGSIRVRSKYNFDEKNKCIEVTEIPSTTCVEAIIDKILELVKARKITEISDMLNYASVYAFSKAFTNKFGCSPRTFRNKNGKI